MNVHVRADDERCIEVLASGLPTVPWSSIGSGYYLAVRFDVWRGAARVDGIVCNTARAEKERTYRELTAGNRCLVVVTLETGGRWSTEGLEFVKCLAHARARETTCHTGSVSISAWRKRWSRMISISCARAFATSLLAGPRDLHAVAGADGGSPDAADLFNEA